MQILLSQHVESAGGRDLGTRSSPSPHPSAFCPLLYPLHFPPLPYPPAFLLPPNFLLSSLLPQGSPSLALRKQHLDGFFEAVLLLEMHFSCS